jgi:hypothetical protein
MALATETTVTNVSIVQVAGQQLVVQRAATADVNTGPDAVGVILNAPLVNANGGPRSGAPPLGWMYRMNATDPATNQAVQVEGLRYIGLTPGGNAQYTTE